MHIIPPRSTAQQSKPGIIFAEDFDDWAEPVEQQADPASLPPPEPPPLTEDDIAAARQQGFDAGRLAGLEEVENRKAAAVAQALEQIGTLVSTASEEHQKQIEQSLDYAGRLLFGALAAVLPSLSKREAPAEIATLIRDYMRKTVPENMTTLKIHPDIVDEVRKALSILPRAHAKMIVIEADEDMPPGDARLVVGKGAVTRYGKMALEAVNEALRSCDLLPVTTSYGPTTQATAPTIPQDHTQALPLEAEHA